MLALVSSMTFLRHTFLVFALVAGVLAAAGCQRARLADSVDLEFDFLRLLGPSDRLHSPYVAGADFHVYSIGVDEDEGIGWRIFTSDPAVMRVDETLGDGHVSVTAVSAGIVDLILNDERGEEIHRASVDVIEADRADLVAHGAMIIGRDELQPERTDEIQVLVGGLGTFLVEWYGGEERLLGHGALTAESDEGADALPRRTFLFEDREWVTFTALEPGRHDVRLMANGNLVRTITIVAVDEDAIDHVLLHGMDESGASDGEPLTVYAQAYDADGVPIYGVEYQWDLDGAPQVGLGDLYRYEFESGRERTLCARHNEQEAFASIHAAGGWVDSTNRLGCSVGVAGIARGFALPALAALAPLLLVWRRRRGR